MLSIQQIYAEYVSRNVFPDAIILLRLRLVARDTFDHLTRRHANTPIWGFWLLATKRKSVTNTAAERTTSSHVNVF